MLEQQERDFMWLKISQRKYFFHLDTAWSWNKIEDTPILPGIISDGCRAKTSSDPGPPDESASPFSPTGSSGCWAIFSNISVETHTAAELELPLFSLKCKGKISDYKSLLGWEVQKVHNYSFVLWHSKCTCILCCAISFYQNFFLNNHIFVFYIILYCCDMSHQQSMVKRLLSMTPAHHNKTNIY